MDPRRLGTFTPCKDLSLDSLLAESPSHAGLPLLDSSATYRVAGAGDTQARQQLRFPAFSN